MLWSFPAVVLTIEKKTNPPFSEQTGGEWMWPRESKSPSGLVRVLSILAFKCQVLVRSLVAFVLMSTVTALTVRTLLSSGVVIMFPMVMLMERMGLQGVDMHVSVCVYV